MTASPRSAPARSQRAPLVSGQWTIVPGFVDLHVHGGGGHNFTAGDPDAVVLGVEFICVTARRRRLLSLVTAPADDLEAAARRISGLLEEATPQVRRRIAGIHAEGPFLSAARCGAQDPEFMADPDAEIIDALVAAAGGHLRMMTIAPERHGGDRRHRPAHRGRGDRGHRSHRCHVRSGASRRSPPGRRWRPTSATR